MTPNGSKKMARGLADGWALAVGTLALGLMSQASPARAAAANAEQIAHGEYLTNMGDCVACHTPVGAPRFSGGRYLETPFGEIASPNLTADKETGIGTWTDDDFYRAMHEGIRKDGEPLYPIFPYTWFTKVTRDDALAIKAYLFSLPPAHAPQKPNRMTFPFNVRQGLSAYNAVFFKPGTFKPDPSKSDKINRGAYLVEGLGHCGACHTPRNFALAPKMEQSFAGAKIPGQSWYAPNISSDPGEGIGDWSEDQIATFLKNGAVQGKGVAFGPMSETVHDSLSKISDEDLHAIGAYLKSTPSHDVSEDQVPAAYASASGPGAGTYLSYCASCHQRDGKGIAGAIPPLAGNGAVDTKEAQNSIRVILGGLQAVGDWGPMPSYGADMTDQQIADVTNYIRTAWGNRASPNATPGQVAELKAKTRITLAGDNANCPPVGPLEPAIYNAITKPESGVVEEMKNLPKGGPNMLDSITQIITKTKAAAPQAKRDDIVNGLMTAYCPIIAKVDDLSQDQKRWRFNRFGQVVYSELRSGKNLQSKNAK